MMIPCEQWICSSFFRNRLTIAASSVRGSRPGGEVTGWAGGDGGRRSGQRGSVRRASRDALSARMSQVEPESAVAAGGAKRAAPSSMYRRCGNRTADWRGSKIRAWTTADPRGCAQAS